MSEARWTARDTMKEYKQIPTRASGVTGVPIE